MIPRTSLILPFFFSFFLPNAGAQDVLNTNDSGPGSLRQALADASLGATITFDTELSGETILLSSPVVITQSVTVDASDLSDEITISGTNTQLLTISGSAGRVILDSLTFSGGRNSSGSGAAIECSSSDFTLRDCTFSENQSRDSGGAVFFDGDAIGVENCRFENNTAGAFPGSSSAHGGAVFLGSGSATLFGCHFYSNTAGNLSGGNGGAIFQEGGTLTINQSTIESNLAGINGGHGGGISTSGNLTINRSTLEANRAGPGETSGGTSTGGSGGAIHAAGATLKINNSTIHGNFAGPGSDEDDSFGGNGGAIFLESGPLTVVNSTITGNQAGSAAPGAANTSTGGNGGGIHAANGLPQITLENTIVAQNFGGTGATSGGQFADISRGNRFLLVRGRNLIGSNEGLDTFFPAPATAGTANGDGHFVGSAADPLNPLLAPITENGGATRTRIPLNSSPSINPHGGEITSDFSTDQRGAARVISGIVDIGAVEFDPGSSDNTLLIRSLENKIKKLKRKVRGQKRKIRAQRSDRRKVSQSKRKIRKWKRSIRNLKRRLATFR